MRQTQNTAGILNVRKFVKMHNSREYEIARQDLELNVDHVDPLRGPEGGDVADLFDNVDALGQVRLEGVVDEQ